MDAVISNAKRGLGALLATAACGAILAAAAAPAEAAVSGRHAAVKGDAMWIWNLDRSSGGSPAAIAAKAKARGIESVFVKAGDAGNVWSQFSSTLVKTLKAQGLYVCGWQYVYGRKPSAEARAAIAAIKRGADCFIIDAETEYKTKYKNASIYVKAIRKAVGAKYPLALSTFPYVDYHPTFPYSVFLGPGAAQYNLPQVYWHTIGDSPKASLEHTAFWNRPYGRQVMPVGQLYPYPGRRFPSRQAILKFRRLAVSHGMQGVSWWSWEHAAKSGWKAVGPSPVTKIAGYSGVRGMPLLSKGGPKGDFVVWAQQLLAAGGFFKGSLSYGFGNGTRKAVESFQKAKALAVTGKIDERTWKALLKLRANAVRFTDGNGSSPRLSRGGTLVSPEPRGSLPTRYEFPTALSGAGHR